MLELDIRVAACSGIMCVHACANDRVKRFCERIRFRVLSQQENDSQYWLRCVVASSAWLVPLFLVLVLSSFFDPYGCYWRSDVLVVWCVSLRWPLFWLLAFPFFDLCGITVVGPLLFRLVVVTPTLEKKG